MLRWTKLGKVFDPTVVRPQPWMQEYAQCPTPLILDDDRVRVYFACRPGRGTDMQYVSHPGYVDLDRHDLARVLAVSEQPLIPLGAPGAFDEFGIMPSSVLRHEGKVYMYYTGWTRMQSVPYTLAIGLAVSDDGGTHFRKLGTGPVLGLGLHEPYFVTGPAVLRVKDEWRMWYLSCSQWLTMDGKQEPVYQIALAKSSDGLNWRHDGRPVVPRLSAHECQDLFSPFFAHGRWQAIFAWREPGVRMGAYRLGYAVSDDLETWVRDDSLVGIDLSASGWDSQMMCYPQLLELDGRTIMFYCGNEFGREGFGMAQLVAEDTKATE